MGRTGAASLKRTDKKNSERGQIVSKNIHLLFFTLLLGASQGSPACASFEPGVLVLTPIAGMAFLNVDGNSGQAPNAGFKLGYGVGSQDLPKELHVEGMFSAAKLSPPLVSSSTESYALRIGPLWAFAPQMRITPLVSAGFGMLFGNSNPQTKTAVNPFISLGCGASYDTGRRFAIRADAVRFQTLDASVARGYELTLGLSYTFDKPATKGSQRRSDVPVQDSAPYPGERESAATTAAQAVRVGSLPAKAPPGTKPTLDAGTKPGTGAGAAAPLTPDRAQLPAAKIAGVQVQAALIEKRADVAAQRLETLTEESARFEPSTQGLSGIASIETVPFAPGSHGIPPPCWKQLKRVADLVKANPQLQIRIAAHTDNIGAPHANYLLSQQRARCIKKHLVKVLGVLPSSISAKGYGPYQPVAGNAGVEGRKANRRAVAIVVAKKIKPHPARVPGGP